MTMKLHAYCINLASDKLRKSHCEQEYAKTNMSFEFLEAVDGREQNIEPEAANSKEQQTRWGNIDSAALSIGFFNRGTNSAERACALSHAMAWKKISETPDAEQDVYFMVNEDDFNVLSTDGLNEALDEATRLDFDMIYLGYRGGNYSETTFKESILHVWHGIKWHLSDKSDIAKFRKNLVLLGKARVHPKSHHYYHSGMTWGGHAYLLNREGARKLLSYNENLRFLPDEAFRYAILDGNFSAGMSKVKFFGCDTKFGSALRSQDDHDAHHQAFPAD